MAHKIPRRRTPFSSTTRRPVIVGRPVHSRSLDFKNELGNYIALSGGVVDGFINYQMAGPDSVTDQTMTRLEARKLRDLLTHILEEDC